MFYDRIDAGLALAMRLKKFSNEPGVVLAVPRGGIPIAYVVAKELGFPLDILLTKKIGHPSNKEYAIGAVSLSDAYIIPHKDVTTEYIENETEKIRERLREIYRKFKGNDQPINLKGKTVIVIDDGIATGNTLMATIKMLKKSNPGKLIIAAPVASESAVEKLSLLVDEVICLLIPTLFYGVGAFYENFEQLTDEDVMKYLDELRKEDEKKTA